MKCPHCDRHNKFVVYATIDGVRELPIVVEQAARMLTDEETKELAMASFDSFWDADDETLVNKYGHGVYLWRFTDFARAAIEAFCRINGIKIGESNG